MKDITIVGGGPGGYVAAIRAAQLGMKVCLIESNKLGGVCLNEGCIPTKTLLKSGKLLGKIKNSSEYGIQFSDLQVKIEEIIHRKDTVVNRLVSGIDYLMKKNNIEVINGEGIIKDNQTVMINGSTEEIKTKNIIIATGSKNVKPNIPGIDLDRVLFSSEALNLKSIPTSLVIIGGGVIGIEFATFFNALGSKVTIVEAMENILPNMDIEIANMLRKMLLNKNIDIKTSTYIKEIKADYVIVERDKEKYNLEYEYVLCAIGRQPTGIKISNSNLSLELNKNAIKTNKKMETNLKNIYCIGDANGNSMLAHTAMKEGIIAVENIAGENKYINYENIPSIVYSAPEVASLGLTEEQCLEKKIQYKVGKSPYSVNGMALAEGEVGLVKVIIGHYNELLGIHIIGDHASDLIMEGCIAKSNELTVDEIIETVHPHPTISEVLQEAFLNSLDIGIHT